MNSTITRSGTIGAVAAMVALSGAAGADWPNSADTPLLIGPAQGPGDERHAMVVSEDGAVWVAWQEPFCVGDLRLQRVSRLGQVLAPGGIAAQPDPTCGAVLRPDLVARGADVVLARASADVRIDPVQRFDGDGVLLWENTWPGDEAQTMQGLSGLSNGDLLMVSRTFFDFYVDRLDDAGNAVWSGPLVFNPGTPSAALDDVVSDGGDGAFLFWSWHTTYRKTMRVARVTPEGELAFAPVPPMELGELEGFSRHTPPAFASDGAGGAYIVWTEGAEQSLTPMPMRMQRVSGDGSLAFPIEGLRVSLGTDRQYDPAVQVDASSGDLFIVWRDGLPGDQTVRAQRMSPEGDRLWGDEGVAVSDVDALYGRFAALWREDTLTIPMTGPNGVRVFRVDAGGVVSPDAVLISPATTTRAIRAANVDDGTVVVWQSATSTDTNLYAQRLNDDGRLGDPACSAADFVEPFGELNFFDVAEFLEAFSLMEERADIVHDGAFNIFDLLAYLTAFEQGCP